MGTIVKKKVSRQAQKLVRLRASLLRSNKAPLYKERTRNEVNPVFGEGNPSAKIVFIGEAPGRNEAKTGRPFVGTAGKILDTLLASIKLSRDKVYITNLVKDRPPKNRAPLPNEVRWYAPYLEKEIFIIQPRIIAPLGRHAVDYILKKVGIGNPGIGKVHGKIFKGNMGGLKVNIIPLYHPAAVIYSRPLLKTLKKDFKVLKRNG
jgi:DNA polymerase